MKRDLKSFEQVRPIDDMGLKGIARASVEHAIPARWAYKHPKMAFVTCKLRKLRDIGAPCRRRKKKRNNEKPSSGALR